MTIPNPPLSRHPVCRPGLSRRRRAVVVWLTTAMLGLSASSSRAQAPEATPPDVLADKPIASLKASISLPQPVVQASIAPENIAAPRLAEEGLQYQPTGLGRGWMWESYAWEPTALRHLPLYFEEPNLERLGYYYGYPCDGRVRRKVFCSLTEYMNGVHDDSPLKCAYFSLKCKLDAYQPHNQVIQPMVSAANFFGRVAMLPYMVGADHPKCEVYEYGVDRPGSPVCYRKHYMPLSLKGMIYQGAVSTGLPYVIP
jgi:hypothetical protein